MCDSAKSIYLSLPVIFSDKSDQSRVRYNSRAWGVNLNIPQPPLKGRGRTEPANWCSSQRWPFPFASPPRLFAITACLTLHPNTYTHMLIQRTSVIRGIAQLWCSTACSGISKVAAFAPAVTPRCRTSLHAALLSCKVRRLSSLAGPARGRDASGCCALWKPYTRGFISHASVGFWDLAV